MVSVRFCATAGSLDKSVAVKGSLSAPAGTVSAGVVVSTLVELDPAAALLPDEDSLLLLLAQAESNSEPVSSNEVITIAFFLMYLSPFSL
ncbi:hypothetical protein D3C78_1865240 [compost metagenome]